MKSTIKRIVSTMLLTGALALPALGQGKIGTIDLAKVFEKYWKLQPAEASLKQKEQEAAKEMQGFKDDFNKTKEEYDKLSAAASDQSKSDEERSKARSAADSKMMELRQADNTIRTYRENATEKLDAQKKRMRETLLQDIQAAINAKAKLSGYTLVVDTAAIGYSGTPVVLYSSGENDITDAILTQLNAGAPPDATKTSEKK